VTDGVSDLFTASSAVMSACGRYRYRLERDGPGEGRTVVIMVNPSTADAEEDDATIRKVKGFGRHNGWGRIIVGNLFAFRATDVRELGKVTNPVGPDNDGHLRGMMDEADRVVFAWGRISKIPKNWRYRWRNVRDVALSAGKQPLCIGETTACGHPPHPLILAYETPIVPWSPPQ
jgi:hypothetical protein